MRLIPLANTPNQTFTVTLDGARWVVRLTSAAGVLAADITRDGVVLLTGCRIIAGELFIPYRYLETGNFLFLTSGDALPEWSQLGASQTLVYLSAAEMAAIRANPLTIADVTPTVIGLLTDNDGFYLTTDGGEVLEDA